MSTSRPRREPTPARTPARDRTPRTPRQALQRLGSMLAGLLVVAASVTFYWMSLGEDPIPPSRTSVLMREPVQQQLDDGYLLGARLAFDLGPQSPLASARDGSYSYLANASQTARIKRITESYLAARGREAVTSAGLARTRADILQQLNAQGLKVTALKFSDLTVVPPDGSWLLAS